MGMIQPECGAGGGCCGSQGPQASGREWMLCFFQRNGGNGCLKQVSRMSHFTTMGGWKSGSPASNPRRLKASKSWFSTINHWLAAVASIRQPRSQSIPCNPKLGYHKSIFCKHDTTTTLTGEACCRSQGPPASGRECRLRFHKRHGFRSRQTSLFGSASHFANMGSWKAGSPTSNPLLQKVLRTQSQYCNKSWRPLCFSAWDKRLFLKLQRRDGDDARIMYSWCSVLPLWGTSSFW